MMYRQLIGWPSMFDCSQCHGTDDRVHWHRRCLDCSELGVGRGGWVKLKSGINGMEGMEEFVFQCRSRVEKEVVAEFYGIGGEDSLGGLLRTW